MSQPGYVNDIILIISIYGNHKQSMNHTSLKRAGLDKSPTALELHWDDWRMETSWGLFFFADAVYMYSSPYFGFKVIKFVMYMYMYV